MNNDVHYSNAPITEAIIDIRVAFDGGAKLKELKQSSDCFSASFPQEETIVEAVSQMEIEAGVDSSTSMQQRLLGFKRTNDNKNRIVQLRRNGFAFSWLAPYDRWESFRDEAQKLWVTYQRVTNPTRIIRLAVRYINRIDIPTERVELKEYFHTFPEISPDLPQEVEQFFMQLRLPQPDILGFVILNQTVVPPSRAGVSSVILDIDLFRTQDVPQDDEQVWRFFEQLHFAKNKIFEACITDTTRGLFE